MSKTYIVIMHVTSSKQDKILSIREQWMSFKCMAVIGRHSLFWFKIELFLHDSGVGGRCQMVMIIPHISILVTPYNVFKEEVIEKSYNYMRFRNCCYKVCKTEQYSDRVKSH